MFRKGRTIALVGTVIAGVMTSGVVAASAAPPSNDDRANATHVAVPSTTSGTTVGSTLQSGEPNEICFSTDGSVWYRVDATSDQGVVVTVAAAGNLDVEVTVFRLQRSQLEFQDCTVSDAQGRAAIGFSAAAGSSYLIRVGQLAGSESNTFTLRLSVGPPPAQPPGRGLPAQGARGAVEFVIRPDVAYHVHLVAGRPYRINLVSGRAGSQVCPQLDLFAAGTTSFDESPVLTRGCDGYAVFAPPISGRYYLRVSADPYETGPQPFRLLLGPAGRDDLAPGVRLPNITVRKGHVNGRTLDVVDLYRIEVARRSRLDVTLRSTSGGDLGLRLRGGGGRTLAAADGTENTVSVRVDSGVYYARVRALGGGTSYRIFSRARTITHTRVSFDGFSTRHVLPNTSVSLGVSVSPQAHGSALVQLEHYDPFEGWLPFRHAKLRVTDGHAAFRWTPPLIGRWRARADYAGTGLFAPSGSDFALLTVDAPLVATRFALR